MWNGYYFFLRGVQGVRREAVHVPDLACCTCDGIMERTFFLWNGFFLAKGYGISGIAFFLLAHTLPCSRDPKFQMPKRLKHHSSVLAVKEAGIKIAQAIGDKGVDALLVPGCQNLYAVPSCTIPHHIYKVHLTPSDNCNSCQCVAHTIHRIRPCKHVLALKKAIKMQRN